METVSFNIANFVGKLNKTPGYTAFTVIGKALEFNELTKKPAWKGWQAYQRSN